MIKVIMPLTICVCMCACAPHKRQVEVTPTASVVITNRTPSDEDQIKLVICEYLIRTVLKPSHETVLFVGVNEADRQALSSRMPGLDLRPGTNARYVKGQGVRDTLSNAEGLLLSVQRVTVTGDRALADGGYLGAAGVMFRFELRKEAEWKVSACSSGTVAD